MSNLRDPKECREWVNAWRVHYLSRTRPLPSLLVEKLERTLKEQIANRLGMRQHAGREWEEYGKSLEILSNALEDAKKMKPEDFTLDWFAIQ